MQKENFGLHLWHDHGGSPYEPEEMPARTKEDEEFDRKMIEKFCLVTNEEEEKRLASDVAMQALLRYNRDGQNGVIRCPRCECPVYVTHSEHGERTWIRCGCGLVRSGEINF